jgi:hypothetical protein
MSERYENMAFDLTNIYQSTLYFKICTCLLTSDESVNYCAGKLILVLI